MKNRTRLSAVKLKVRHNALLLREFTIDDLVRATGLKPESVRTEVQRMKKEDLVSAEPLLDNPSGRRGRRALYRISADAEARLKLARSIEEFHVPHAEPQLPSSRYYASAVSLLDRAESLTGPERSRLLKVASEDLEDAGEAEGGEFTPPRVRLYLRFQHARLSYLHARHEVAVEEFQAIRPQFVQIEDWPTVERIDEYLFCMRAWKDYCKGRMLDSVGAVYWGKCLLDWVAKEPGAVRTPLNALLVEVMERLIRPELQAQAEIIRSVAAEMSRLTGPTPDPVQESKSPTFSFAPVSPHQSSRRPSPVMWTPSGGQMVH